jgi:hypothetical protein
VFVEIIDINQKLDLRTRVMANVLTFRLKTGRTVTVPVDAAVAQELISAAFSEGVHDTLPPEENDSIPPQEGLTSDDDEGNAVFGGRPEGLDPESTYPAHVEEPLPPPLPAPVRRAVRVEKDEFGYPIIRDGSAVDVSTVTGGGNADEDGVGSV